MFSTLKDTAREKDNMTNEGGLSDAAAAYRAKKEQIAETISESKKDLREAKRKMEDAGHNISDIAHRAGEQVRNITDQVRDYAGNASHNVQDIAETMTAKIRNKPLQSASLALLAGVVVGRLFFSRSK